MCTFGGVGASNFFLQTANQPVLRVHRQTWIHWNYYHLGGLSSRTPILTLQAAELDRNLKKDIRSMMDQQTNQQKEKATRPTIYNNRHLLSKESQRSASFDTCKVEYHFRSTFYLNHDFSCNARQWRLGHVQVLRQKDRWFDHCEFMSFLVAVLTDVTSVMPCNVLQCDRMLYDYAILLNWKWSSFNV